MLEKAPEHYANMIGAALGPSDPCVCHDEFTLTVNREHEFGVEQVKAMLEATGAKIAKKRKPKRRRKEKKRSANERILLTIAWKKRWRKKGELCMHKIF